MMLAQAQRENRVLESTVNEQLEVNEQYKSTSNALQAELRAAHVRVMEVKIARAREESPVAVGHGAEPAPASIPFRSSTRTRRSRHRCRACSPR